MKKENLYCSDGQWQAANAIYSKDGWRIFALTRDESSGELEYEKVLYDMTFDELIPYNSFDGVSYVAVKKDDLWGLIRFRQNPEYTVNKKYFEKAIGSEPIDESLMDPIGREIKLIEEITHPNIDYLIEKYDLNNVNKPISRAEMEKEYSDKDKTPTTETWSEETCRYTEDALRDLEFGWDPSTGNVMMKKKGGGYGHIEMSDALKHIYRIVKEDVGIEEFYTVEELTKAGWALD